MASSLLPLPQPRTKITIRAGVLSDIPFLDELQKLHSKQVGWMPTKQFEGKIQAGQVLIAEAMNVDGGVLSVEGSQQSTINSQHSRALGYCIAHDQYFKRDDVGIIYQMNVAPGHQRGLVGASLLKAQFERSAYGCRLYCCWCAQDIEANRFWEAMGFVPLAFRAGSQKKSRVHIFWQRRICAGDETTPWWFPAQTSGGSIREDRIVLPIPPGTHWSDAKPLILPGRDENRLALGDASVAPAKKPKPRKEQLAAMQATAKPRPLAGALFFTPPQPPPTPATREAPVREKKAKAKNDPKLVAAARELRDRWLEQVNSGQLIAPAQAKYAVGRALPGGAEGAGPRNAMLETAGVERARALPMLPADAAENAAAA